MTIIKGSYVITSELIALPVEEDTVFEIKGDKIAVGSASSSVRHRVFDIHHVTDKSSSRDYHRIYTPDGSKILVSPGAHKGASFKKTTSAEKDDYHSWWGIKKVSTSASGKSTYKIKNRSTGNGLATDVETVEFWTTSEFQNRVKRDRAGIDALNHPRPTHSHSHSHSHSKPATTSNLCGNPTCGIDHICAADYNRNVKPMGYPGV